MCGICGIVSRSKSIEFDIVRQMNDAIAHRGPDDEGFLLYNSLTKNLLDLKRDNLQNPEKFKDNFNFYLGHRRLSIIDVSERGHQPFVDSSGMYYIILNGEIYNYIELREMLMKKGYKFRSQTDTEVLLNLYIEYGEKCLDMLNGMWAFVILDLKRNSFFGSRDRFGVKPFYYFYDKDYFIFSSEVKSLIRAPQIKREINQEAAFDFLTIGRIINEGTTLFKNIFELEPSAYFNFEFNNFNLNIHKYYKLDFNSSPEKFDERKSDKYIKDIREKVFDAVNLRLRSDVKVGSCLSGGIDSSTIVCVVNSLLKDHKMEQVGDLQKVFTAVYPDTKIDETKWAAMVSEQTMSEWFTTFPKAEDLLKDIEKLAYVQDVPFGSTSIYSQFRVMKLASENKVKVLLDGQGGDELFTGYAFFYRAFFNELIKNRNYDSLIREFNFLMNSPISKNKAVRNLIMSFAKLYFPSNVKRLLFNLKVKENNLLERNFYNIHKDRLDLGRFIEFTSLNEVLYDQYTKTSLRELLKYEDRNSMNFSIEARVPFADDINLVDYVFNIPSVYKIRDGWTKYLLRQAMSGIIPEEIRQRRDKLGFATPEFNWLNLIKDDLKKYFTPDMDEYLNTKLILKDWDTIFSNQTKTGITNFWRFISFAIWKKVFNL